jgi:hypothetical protein
MTTSREQALGGAGRVPGKRHPYSIYPPFLDVGIRQGLRIAFESKIAATNDPKSNIAANMHLRIKPEKYTKSWSGCLSQSGFVISSRIHAASSSP